MSDQPAELSGPDLATEGALPSAIPDGGMLLGHAGGSPVLLARRGSEVFALEATCSHYGGPLAEGLFDGACVHCPWHHAAFDVRTGAVVQPPAYKPLTAYAIDERDGRLFVGAPLEAKPRPAPIAAPPSSVVIVGGGAAGNAAAETLRLEGYAGPVTIVTDDAYLPYDRPNLSKDYLAGTAPEDWIPLRSSEFYKGQRIELLLGRRAVRVDSGARRVYLDDGQSLEYDALLLATGAEPVRLDTPGSDLPHVHYLRTFDDSRAIIAGAAREGVPSAVVVGASFIGLEVAASLRTRGVETHVVAPEAIPMERVLGPQLGEFVQALHVEHGVHFHLERKVTAIDERSVTLDDGTRIEAGLVVFGVGVSPALDLAEAAAVSIDKGVVVDEYLATSVPGIWAAGDIARWPDQHSGQSIRVEHWVVAQRQGHTAALNMLGRGRRFDAVPFFWSQHYDVPINYVGHAEHWDRIDVSGDIAGRDCIVAFREAGRTLAVASIYRDEASLQAEQAMERGDEAALQALIPPASA
ncbi:MAG: pyridine nucleotide-disulfide oxidoreductase [Dehalococcoidia bacterium]|nr:MAG: pyridine nucleotide-disulfide oxidoreductase [Dehalococcoidia bacterium]